MKSVITTQIPWLKLNPSGVYVVVIFLSQVIFGLLLLLGMLMSANEVETIRKIKITLGKKKLTTTFTFNKVKSLYVEIQRGFTQCDSE